MLSFLKTSINSTKATIYSTYYICERIQFVITLKFERVENQVQMNWVSYKVSTRITPPYKNFKEFIEMPQELLKGLVLILIQVNTLNFLIKTETLYIESPSTEHLQKIKLFFTWSSSLHNLEDIETIKVFDDVIYDKSVLSEKQSALFFAYLLKPASEYFLFIIELNQQSVKSGGIIVSFKRKKFKFRINIAVLKYVELVVKRTGSSLLVIKEGFIDLSGFFTNYERNNETALYTEVNVPTIEENLKVKVEAKKIGKGCYTELKLVELQLLDKSLYTSFVSPKTTSAKNLINSKTIFTVVFFLCLVIMLVIYFVALKKTNNSNKNQWYNRILNKLIYILF